MLLAFVTNTLEIVIPPTLVLVDEPWSLAVTVSAEEVTVRAFEVQEDGCSVVA